VDEVETEHFYVHGCFALVITGKSKSNIQEGYRLAFDSATAPKRSARLTCFYVNHLEKKGKAHICNFQGQPVFTNCNKLLSDATCPGKRIDTCCTPVFGSAEKGRVGRPGKK
jgi:hypothetical protein